MSAMAETIDRSAVPGGTARIDRRFAALKAEGRAGLVTFVTAGDPDLDTGARVLAALAEAGADVIELGVPFTDPMADGPAIQRAGLRALAAGVTMIKVLDMVRAFRATDTDTPVILMGYYNPIYAYGAERFAADAMAAGVDGLIVVDLPAEEEEELVRFTDPAGLALVRLVAPTTSVERLPSVVGRASGFLYYVSITGITGTASADISRVAPSVARIRAASELPVAIGFGIKTPEQAAAFAAIGDAVVVGSAIVQEVEQAVADGAPETAPDRVRHLVSRLAGGVQSAAARA
ncbi:MAG: tryptophan synthase subunit alpha [Tistrella sp.]|uniref:Tryptophan synthase alpha chain n=2 Tax=Tistrella TaxID=171436 RepID=A0A3B9IG03_9PROT|nr:tryptophan synthase subunit alpha [Tistrella sp.]MBA79187.1 tryptophan synthase subunit alpha [Tistrella sp.]HAE46794.1 tryptophan synthase subunit alpha [Tistrella mobilis]